jgi:hypothetical protein
VVAAITRANPASGAQRGQTQCLQPLTGRPAQAGARIGTGDDADQGDADLHGGQELARIPASAAHVAPPCCRDRPHLQPRGRAETIASSDMANSH